MKNIVIDIHAHFIPRLLYERFDANSTKFPGVKLLRDEKGKRLQFPGGEPTRPILPKLSDTAEAGGSTASATSCRRGKASPGAATTTTACGRS
ncbi:MAG: hypothetical protein E6H75_00460 [Betaproteobacteria bacterium]|nr:MAG: hypothetical protein E6H75_00460 [Betaproteobacteria bacterium]